MNDVVLDRIKFLLRRDLKLGHDAIIGDDMPLIGGDMDLDSIDVLLVLTSVEKEFGVQLAGEKIEKSAFRSVGTLAEFVRGLLARSANTGAVPQGTVGGRDWLTSLPHGPEFRFVTEVLAVEPGRSASGTWRAVGNEHFFAGHFPGRPVVPGVLIGEGLAQIAGIAAGAGAGMGDARGVSSGQLAQIDVRFLHPVVPPATIELRASVLKVLGSLHQYDVAAEVGGMCVASGVVTLHVMPGA